jgi:hypothetical protein
MRVGIGVAGGARRRSDVSAEAVDAEGEDSGILDSAEQERILNEFAQRNRAGNAAFRAAFGGLGVFLALLKLTSIGIQLGLSPGVMALSLLADVHRDGHLHVPLDLLLLGEAASVVAYGLAVDACLRPSAPPADPGAGPSGGGLSLSHADAGYVPVRGRRIAAAALLSALLFILLLMFDLRLVPLSLWVAGGNLLYIALLLWSDSVMRSSADGIAELARLKYDYKGA